MIIGRLMVKVHSSRDHIYTWSPNGMVEYERFFGWLWWERKCSDGSYTTTRVYKDLFK